ncbi:MAG: SPOR domain-containing protein [Candidatus Accumulibacter sp.]|jgi:cell division protein FtsN|nr:SPOR domain-containing protein [Accumulibacter sp.]
MSRDSKPAQRAGGTRRKSAGGTLLGLFVGLVVGVLAAAAVVWYIHRTPPPFSPRMQTPAPADSQAPLALPGKPGDPIPQQGDRPRFDFYTILPGETSPETRPGPAARPTETDRSEAAKTALREQLFLQTGSFQNAADADHQKARLAMMGIEAGVQQVMLQDKVWYRVRLGPFGKIEDVNALRAELARQGMEANVVRRD